MALGLDSSLHLRSILWVVVTRIFHSVVTFAKVEKLVKQILFRGSRRQHFLTQLSQSEQRQFFSGNSSSLDITKSFFSSTVKPSSVKELLLEVAPRCNAGTQCIGRLICYFNLAQRRGTLPRRISLSWRESQVSCFSRFQRKTYFKDCCLLSFQPVCHLKRYFGRCQVPTSSLAISRKRVPGSIPAASVFFIWIIRASEGVNLKNVKCCRYQIDWFSSDRSCDKTAFKSLFNSHFHLIILSDRKNTLSLKCIAYN